jgi:hypothetical protein
MLTSSGYATGKGRHASSPMNQPSDVKASMPTKLPSKASLHNAGGKATPVKGTGPC